MARPPAPLTQQSTLWVAATPFLFVILWSTGFIGAKLGLPDAEPYTFLLVRFIAVVALLAGAAFIAKADWPRRATEIRDLAVIGVLIHGVYLGGVFSAIARGVPAGVAALIVGLQPLVTAVIAGPYLGERISPKQWAGLLIGIAGVALVVADKLDLRPEHVVGVAFCIAALLGISFGTLYQKRHAPNLDLRSGSAVQFMAAGAMMLVLALAFETMEITWSGEFIFALTWLVVVLSLGAISLLYQLLRRGGAAKVASLFYLVPPVTAVFAYLLFGETLSALAIVGMGAAVVAVALVMRG